MSYLLLKTKFCSLHTPHTKFSLNKNMPHYNHFDVNCYLKATCNLLFLRPSLSLSLCLFIFSLLLLHLFTHPYISLISTLCLSIFSLSLLLLLSFFNLNLRSYGLLLVLKNKISKISLDSLFFLILYWNIICIFL